jgi:cytoplasmic iron level regulating protein YaaA (DUF328/UPF0246 family)
MGAWRVYVVCLLALLSPQKRLDFESKKRRLGHSQPEMLDDASTLVSRAAKLRPKDLIELMGISSDLAELNVQRFQDFQTPFTPDNAKQAILAFRGDAYLGFDVDTLDAKTIRYAQDHLRILSGLYGLLRPLDLIQPYRLEMGVGFKPPRAANLYEFWGNRITDQINEAVSAKRGGVVVNLASNEYFNSVKKSRLNSRLVTCVFKEVRNGEARVFSFNAKRARGMMARFICERRPRKVDDLREFTSEGYRYDASSSTDDVLEFHRKSA